MKMPEYIEQQARLLAADNRQAEPSIEAIYWFPHAREVRLVEITPVVPLNGGDILAPFYFPPSPEHDLPAPSSVAMIRPSEWKKLRLPRGWSYDQAVKIANGRKPQSRAGKADA
jgi:hypothetical protein